MGEGRGGRGTSEPLRSSDHPSRCPPSTPAPSPPASSGRVLSSQIETGEKTDIAVLVKSYFTGKLTL